MNTPTFADAYNLDPRDEFCMKSKLKHWLLLINRRPPHWMEEELTVITEDIARKIWGEEIDMELVYRPNPLHERRGVFNFYLRCHTREELTPLVRAILGIHETILLSGANYHTSFEEKWDQKKRKIVHQYYKHPVASVKFTVLPDQELYDAVLRCVAPLMPGGYTWEFFAGGGL